MADIKKKQENYYLIDMVDFLSGSNDMDSARITLLKYYSSECIAHAAYIIATAIVSLGFILALPYFWPLRIVTRIILLGLISSISLTLTIHILGRAFFWSNLASSVLYVVPKKESEIRIENGATVTSIPLLHQACTEYVRRKHRIIGEFHSARIWEIELWLIFLIGFSLIWLALSL